MTLKKLLLTLTLPLYVLDQATKGWTVAHFSEPSKGYFATYDESIKVIKNFFELTRVHNQGVAFGLGNGTAWAPIVFLIVPIVALVAIRYFWRKGLFEHKASQLAVALLIAGILGNLTDRLVQGFLLKHAAAESFWARLSQGYVVDFLKFKLPLYDKIVPKSEGWWPAFNVADSCIFVAAFLLFFSGILEERAKKKAEAK